MASSVVSVVTLVLAGAMLVLVLVELVTRPRVRGGQARQEQVRGRFDLAIGLLGVAIGASLVLRALLGLGAGREANTRTWLFLAAGGLMVLGNAGTLYAKRAGLGQRSRHTAPPPAARSTALDAWLAAAVRDALVRCDKVEAIRLYRQGTGAGLSEAQQAVEALARELEAQAASTLLLQRIGRAAWPGEQLLPDRAEQQLLFEQLRGRMVRTGDLVGGFEIVEVLARQEPALVLDDTALEFV